MTDGEGKAAQGTAAIRAVGVDHLNLRVADLERSLRFYKGLLGLVEVQRDKRPGGGTELLALRAGTAVVFLQPSPDYRPPKDEQASGLDHFSLEIEAQDAAGLVARMREGGVEVVEGPVRRWGSHGQGTSVYVRDPDGHRLELKQYDLG